MRAMHNRRSPLRLLAALLALLAFVAVGCGVEGKDDASGDVDTENTADTDTGTGTGTDDTTADDGAELPDDGAATETPSAETVVPDDGSSSSDADDDTSSSDSDDSSSSDSDDGSSTQIPDGAKEQIVDLYTDMGFTPEQSECLAGKIVSSGGSDVSDMDTAAIMDWFEECNISMSDLSKIGAGG